MQTRKKSLRWSGSSFLFSALALACLVMASCGSDTAKPECGDCSVLDDVCRRGVCNEAEGLCVAEPTNEDGECDDNDRCTLEDKCQAGECTGTPMECNEEATECIAGTCDRGECEYAPKEDGTSCISQADECNNGVCQEGQCTAEAKADNTPCNDGDWCTTPDTCQSGECTGSPRDCADEFTCTDDLCDSGRNACDHPARDGWCLIGAMCHQDGATNPDNACQECVAAMLQNDWTNDDTNACDDGNMCTQPDQCVDGSCQGTPVVGCCLEDADCSDGKDCTLDQCNQVDGTCSNPIQAGFCLIGDLCVPEETLNPANACQECIPATSDTDWSNNNDSCNDGLYCTTNDQCTNGSCQGVSGVICDDSVDCTQDICNETDQNCSHPVMAGNCYIGGTCFPDGTPNPGNACQECMANSDSLDWTDDDTNACDDGNDCTDPDFCSGGACTGTAIPNCCTTDAHCDDGVDCTDEVCDVGSGTCSNPILDTWCYIGGNCMPDSTPNPNNNCQQCDLAVANDAWSPANEGAECGGICQACLAGACQNIPDTGDADPFGECPPCRVCNGSGGCRNATNGTDPKQECSAADCSFDNCQDGSCHMAAGSQCPDANTDDCDDAQCNGTGTCVQDFSFEIPGTSCEDGDVCTGPDQCNSLGQCAGPDIAQDPDPDSTVSATSLCLTATTGARSVIRLDLVDTSGTPISGATVTMESAGAIWAGAVVESSVLPGTYSRILEAPAGAGSATVAFTAQTGSGSCQSPLVNLNGTVTVDFWDPAAAGTGGCPIDSNLRVRVVEAETGAPLAGAYVIVGQGEADLYETDFENVLSGTASLPNTGQTTGANGSIEFEDHGTSLDGPQMVTAGFANRAYVSFADVDAADLIIALPAIVSPQPTSQINGTLTGLPVVNLDGILDAGMVVNQFTMDSLVKFKFDDLLAQEADCWMAADILFMGEQWAALPINIFIPEQVENLLINVTVEHHDYKTIPILNGSIDQNIVALAGTAPFGDVADLLLNDGSLADIIPLLDMERIGVISRAVINGDESNVPINTSTNLSANVSCTIQNKPASLSGSGDLCLGIGDWNGTLGDGPMFIMGFKALEGGTGNITTVPNSGSFAGVGYMGFGVAAYLDPSTLPGGQEWKAGATSGILDRSGSLSASGGSLLFDDFLEITPLNRSGRTYSWNAVSTAATTAHVIEHNIDLVEYITYPIGAECDDVEEDIWRNTYWKIVAPDGTTSFTLPTLPSGWPRAAAGGLATPGAGEYLNWSFAAFHMGPLAASFDFNFFDFGTIYELVTHTSTNNVDF